MKAAGARIALLVGGVYFAVGILFGELAGRAASVQIRVAWRWGAWLVSAAIFGGHILYEHIRQRSSPRITALYVSMAAAVGAFGLAVAANVHAYVASAREHATALGLSLVIWPVMTLLPAFVVALLATLLLARVRRSVTR
jgi:hypothetical protein